MENTPVKKTDETNIYPIHYPVFLSEGKIESFSDFLNLFFEYCILFRWMFFKNRPRGNLLFLRSLLIVGVASLLFFKFRSDFDLVLLGIDVDPLIFFHGAVVAGYWSMLNAFYSKSAACNTVYLEMIKIGGQGNVGAAKLISNSLAIELLTMDLWAHRKYRNLFARNLYRAVEHAYSSNSVKIPMKLPAKMSDMLTRINSRHLQAKEARILLDNYQDFLMYSTNQAAKTK